MERFRVGDPCVEAVKPQCQLNFFPFHAGIYIMFSSTISQKDIITYLSYSCRKEIKWQNSLTAFIGSFLVIATGVPEQIFSVLAPSAFPIFREPQNLTFFWGSQTPNHFITYCSPFIPTSNYVQAGCQFRSRACGTESTNE